MKKIIIKIIIVFGIIIFSYYLISFYSKVNNKYNELYFKREFITNLYKTRGITINPESVRVEIIRTFPIDDEIYYIKNKYGEEIYNSFFTEKLDFSDDIDYSILIFWTIINPYLEKKYNFLEKEKEKLIEYLKDYENEYKIKIDKTILFNFENELISDYYNYTVNIDNKNFYSLTDKKNYFEANLLKKKKIENMDFDKIDPEYITKDIVQPGLVIIIDKKNSSETPTKEEYIKLNNEIKNKVSDGVRLVYKFSF